MKKNNIAIAVLFFNKPEQTIECLQSFKGEKIYLLNNGSNPEAENIVKKYAESHQSNITYISLNSNVGVSKGRNILINAVQEDWIFFIDNDITIATKKWKDIINKTINDNPDMFVFMPQVFNVHEGHFEHFYTFSVVKGKVSLHDSQTGHSNKLSGGASIINKKLFDVNGFYDEGFFIGLEDYEFCLRAIKQGRDLDVMLVDDIVVNHYHKRVTTDYDDDYLQIRYSAENIRSSCNRIYELHQLHLPDDGVKWSENQIEQMISTNTISGKRIRITLWHDNQVKIGGIETFNKNFCKEMSKYYDITFLYKSGYPQSLADIAKYATVVIDEGQAIETDIFIFGTVWTDKPDNNITAKLFIQMLHGDYEWMKNELKFIYSKKPKVTQHIACGKFVATQFKKITGYDSTVVYNILNSDVKVERVLKLISVMRLAKEKGLERKEIMARKLKEANKKFIWHIWGDGSEQDNDYVNKVKQRFSDIQEVVFMGANADCSSYIADSDYLVALSDSEGFSYSIYESLQVGTPCIITNFPSGYEQIEDGVNGYILKMDLSDLDIEKIYSKIPKPLPLIEKSKEQDWIKFFGNHLDNLENL